MSEARVSTRPREVRASEALVSTLQSPELHARPAGHLAYGLAARTPCARIQALNFARHTDNSFRGAMASSNKLVLSSLTRASSEKLDIAALIRLLLP